MVCVLCERNIHNNAYYDIWWKSRNKRWLLIMYTSLPSNHIHYLSESTPGPYYGLREYAARFMCSRCVSSIEITYVKSLPLEELPLLINHIWITKRGTLAYMKRLQTLSPAI